MKLFPVLAIISLALLSVAQAEGTSTSATAPAEVHTFTCQTGWINCMPSIDTPINPYCTREYRVWAKGNCASQPMIAE